MEYEHQRSIYALGRLHHILGLAMKKLKANDVVETIELLGVCRLKLAEIEDELLRLVPTEGASKRQQLQKN